MKHIHAFLSEDGKNGRVWIEGGRCYGRVGDKLYYKRAVNYRPGDKACDIPYECVHQLVAMDGECRWADEPKTLTPQECFLEKDSQD